jgi:AraC-like DNA-binding protein
MSRCGDSNGTISDYLEFDPPPPLKASVLCLWTQSILEAKDTYRHLVLPDGCVDLVLINHDSPTVVGPWTESFVALLPPGTAVVGARFHPGAAAEVLGVPASALLNRTVRLRELWTNAAHEPFAHIADQSHVSSRRLALAEALAKHLERAGPRDPQMSAAIAWLARHPAGRVEQLSEWTSISGRHLQRRFVRTVGYGPKMFQSVLRFQRLLRLGTRSYKRRTLAALSVDAGYADQAHMNREVRRFSGNLPSILLRSAECTLNMSDLFKTDVDPYG